MLPAGTAARFTWLTPSRREKAVADVTDVGGTLHQQLVAGGGKHVVEGLADRIGRRLRNGTAVNGLFHLLDHERVADHLNVALEDFRLFGPGGSGQCLHHLLRLGLEGGNRLLEPLFFSLRSGEGDGTVVEIDLFDDDGFSDSVPFRYADSFLHSSVPFLDIV